MSCTEKVSRQLRARGFRVTPQRLAVLQVLHDGGHLSPAQVYERARRLTPGMTEATVYRALDFLAAQGPVAAVRAGGGRLGYELTDGQHHHLACRRCGADLEVAHDRFADLFARLEAETGYRLQVGHLTLTGLCPDCQPPALGE
jgi:Fur family transcriptional regulator, ferric uptake regulator